MKMEFSQKLDFLMNVTKTTNSMLARYISLDASHISRLRTGSRPPAKNADYIRTMSAYFAKNCMGTEQMEVMMAAINKAAGPVPDMNRPEELISFWLCAEEQDGFRPVGAFLDNLSRISFRKMPATNAAQELQSAAQAEKLTEIYYGAEGKRQAVIAFLSEAIRQETPRTLLLFSEENFDWLTEKREFAALWASLLQQVIMKGNRIKIIHSISRNLDEMLAGIAEWLPIYMTGMVEPYYYPKTRDGIFQRTLFAAPGVAVILSTSVTGKTSKTANYLIRDIKAVEAAEAEFNDYFNLCRPLLYIFREDDAAKLKETHEEFASEQADAIARTGSISMMTMPAEVAAEAGASLSEEERAVMLDNHRQRLRYFDIRIQKQQWHEIIGLPDIEKIRAGKQKIVASDFLMRNDMFYTPQTYKMHLEHVVKLLRQYDNYNVYFDNSGRTDDMIIYVKEDVGVLVAKNSPPSVLFAINESKMTAAFWDYLKSCIGKEFSSRANKQRTIERLEAVIKSI
jgi:hypothetical protein